VYNKQKMASYQQKTALSTMLKTGKNGFDSPRLHQKIKPPNRRLEWFYFLVHLMEESNGPLRKRASGTFLGPGVIGARLDQASEAKPMGAPERFPSPPPQNNRASISFARFSFCKLIHLLIHFFFFLSLRLPVWHSLCPQHLIDEY